jgi:Transposase DDE domain
MEIIATLFPPRKPSSFNPWLKGPIFSGQKDSNMEWVSLDSTIVRVHACAGGYSKDSQAQEALGGSKGGFSTKIHAMVDALLGNQLKFLLTAGQRHDITQAKNLIKESILVFDKSAQSYLAFLQFAGMLIWLR